MSRATVRPSPRHPRWPNPGLRPDQDGSVVTGAGRGIGLALARRLADAGHRVVLTDLDGDAAEWAAAEIGRGAIGLQQDVRDIASHRRVAEEAARLGRLTVWANNAGVLFAGDAWRHPDEELSTILDVNVRGTMAGSAAAVAHMGRDGELYSTSRRSRR